MNEIKELALFLAVIAIKYGIAILGASWMIASASLLLFEQSGALNSGRNERIIAVCKQRIYMGIRILVLGLFMSLIPFK